ncbi:energy transducer TonB [Roseivirga pacifica]|uniref:energy transducer TonB n=1 Tax=Roseivirga pacifica TaxID=1267423 RepID=UPI00227C05D5|nr:energy transducer TonB [Roseivirga pacifica]
MKNTLPTLLLLFLCLTVDAQKIDTVFLDKNSTELISIEGANKYKVKHYDKRGKRLLKEELYSKANVLLQEINYKKDKKDGHYYYKSLQNGTETIGTFSKGVKAGTWYTNNLSGFNLYYDEFDDSGNEIGRFSKKDVPGYADTLKGVEVKIQSSPRYPGGPPAWGNFLLNNLKYPKEAQQRGEEAIVIIRFLVNKDGSLEDFEVINQETPATLQKAALDVVRKSNRWVPATINGHPIDSTMDIRIVFRL